MTNAIHGTPARTVHHATCPWWLGPLLASPIRRLFESPERLLRPLVTPGMRVVEPGCGMGYFTIPLARLVGPEGRVVAVDLQPKMVAGLLRRARRANVVERIDARTCESSDLAIGDVAGTADLAVVIHMLHEVPDQQALLAQLFAALRPGGRLLILEPAGHVTPEALARSLETAVGVGFKKTEEKVPGRELSAVLEK